MPSAVARPPSGSTILPGIIRSWGDRVQAEQAYAKAVELDSTNVQAMKMRAYLQQTVDERRTEQLLLQVVRHRLAKDRLGRHSSSNRECGSPTRLG